MKNKQQKTLLDKQDNKLGQDSDRDRAGIRIMEKEIRKYETFEDYLDSLVIEDDQRYLGDIDTARRLVQLGYRCLGVEIDLQILHFLSL